MSATTIQPSSDWMTRLPLPDATGLTRSQWIFTISTGIHIDSLKIGRDVEFFIFMRLRAEHKWASFKMSPSKWVEATKLYNSALESADQSHGHTTIPKNPRTLMTTLGAVESTISDRIMTGNYKCEPFWLISSPNLTPHIILTAQKGTETFWREHCIRKIRKKLILS
jgi:hypothetical protein